MGNFLWFCEKVAGNFVDTWRCFREVKSQSGIDCTWRLMCDMLGELIYGHWDVEGRLGE